MDTDLRPSGIEGVGDMPWGTHFCLFYETKEDLLDVLIPYFKAGLESDEFCLYVASEPVVAEGAERALREAVPNFERYLAEGQIEIVSHSDWYLSGGHFDPLRVRQAWMDKLNQGLAQGNAGMRFAANTFWLEKEDWDSFAEYEEKVDEAFRKLRIVALCAYALERCSTADMLNVVRHHQFTVAKRNGVWEYLGGSELKRAHDEIRQLNADLERRVLERTAELAATNEQLKLEITARKAAEESLREAQARTESVLASVADTHILLDRQWRYIYVNEAAIRAIGKSREQILESTLWELYPDIVGTELDYQYHRAMDERLAVVFDFHYEVLDTWWANRFYPTPEGLAIFATEITERKHAEALLHAREQEFRAFVENAPDQIIRYDKEFRRTYVNPAVLAAYGLPEEAFIGKPVGSVVEDAGLDPDIDAVTAIRGQIKSVFETGEPTESEVSFPSPGGRRTYWTRMYPEFDLNGVVINVMTISRDITDRKEAEEQLRFQANVLSQVLDVVIAIDNEYRITYWNPAAERLYGFKSDEVLGQPLEQVNHYRWVKPEDEQAANDSLSATGSWRGENIHLKKSGEEIHVESSVSVLKDQSDNTIGLLAIIRDITERKRAEDELRNQKEILQKIFDHSPIMIRFIGTDGKWLMVNHAWERTMGWTLEDIQQPNFDILAEIYPDPREHQRILDFITASAGEWEEFKARVRDGRVLDVAFTNVRLSDGTTLGFGLDITERKQAEAAVRSLLRISEKLHATLDIDALLGSLVVEAMRLTNAEIGWSGLRTEEGMVLHTHISRDLQVVSFPYLWPPEVGLPGWVLAHKVPYVMNDAQSDKLIIPEIRERFDVKAAIDTPILDAQGEVIGFFEVNNKKNGAKFSDSDVEQLVAVARIASIALQNAMLLKAANEQHEQLRALSTKLVKVQEAERRALTTELHDRVGQNLTGFSINLQNMKALLSDEMAQTLAAKFNDAQALVEHTTRQIRDIMAELHLPELEDYGPAAALETYAERAASRGNLELIADLPDLAPPPLPSDISIALFRAAQEAITNVLKHADATQLEVSLEESDGRIRLRVEDDGKGFEPEAATQNEAQTWGLKIIRERIESIGGKVQIESRHGEGTRVTFEIERPS